MQNPQILLQLFRSSLQEPVSCFQGAISGGIHYSRAAAVELLAVSLGQLGAPKARGKNSFSLQNSPIPLCIEVCRQLGAALIPTPEPLNPWQGSLLQRPLQGVATNPKSYVLNFIFHARYRLHLLKWWSLLVWFSLHWWTMIQSHSSSDEEAIVAFPSISQWHLHGEEKFQSQSLIPSQWSCTADP